MAVSRKRQKRDMSLPTISVGGALPPKKSTKEINEEVQAKREEFEKTHLQKPDSDMSPVNRPLQIKSNPYSLDNEYIDLAKKILDIPIERKVTVLELAKAVIVKFEKMNKTIEELKKPRNNSIGRVYFSSEENSSWN